MKKIMVMVFMASLMVSCSNPMTPEAIYDLVINGAKTEITKGENLTLTLNKISRGVEDNAIWTSSNESVATVSKGVVTGVGAGKTIITGSDGNKSASVEITVTIPVVVTTPVPVVTTPVTTTTSTPPVVETPASVVTYTVIVNGISQTVNKNALAIKPTDPTKVGYVFDGWDYDFSTPITSNITINAKWKIATYTVTFKVDNDIYMTKVVNHNELVTPPNPMKPDYTWSWHFNFSTKIISDTIITGIWILAIE